MILRLLAECIPLVSGYIIFFVRNSEGKPLEGEKICNKPIDLTHRHKESGFQEEEQASKVPDISASHVVSHVMVLADLITDLMCILCCVLLLQHLGTNTGYVFD